MAVAAVEFKTSVISEHKALYQAQESVHRRQFIWIALFAIILHLLLLFTKAPFLTRDEPAPVELQDISTERLEALKQKWKDRPLLLAKDKKPKNDEPINQDAKYESDRNRRVEKEQQASRTDVIPKAGSSGQSGEQSLTPEKTIPKTKPRSLSNLGLPMKEYLKPKSAQTFSGPMEEARDQALHDKSLPFGDENILNTQENKYYSFYSRLYETIGPQWQSMVRTYLRSQPLQAGEYLTRVEVVLDPNGNLHDTKVLISSGVSSLDQVVVQAWRKVPSFPNPPKDLLSPDGFVHMGWSFVVTLDQSTGLPSLRPRRDY